MDQEKRLHGEVLYAPRSIDLSVPGEVRETLIRQHE